MYYYTLKVQIIQTFQIITLLKVQNKAKQSLGLFGQSKGTNNNEKILHVLRIVMNNLILHNFTIFIQIIFVFERVILWLKGSCPVLGGDKLKFSISY